MAEWQEGMVTAHGLQLHYIRTGGAGKPGMLMLHGITDNGGYWERTAAALADPFDIVMLDQRGHGKSERPQVYNSRELAEDAAGVINTLDLAPAVVLGHSMGGAVAIELAAAYPDLVARLLLLDPPIWRSAPQQQGSNEERSRRNAARQQELEEQQRLSADELERRCREQHPNWAAEDCHHWTESKLTVYPEVVSLYQWRNNWRELLPKISCPTLLIYGDKALGSIVDDETAAEVAGLLPDVQLAHIHGAGHSAQREQFNDYIKVVRDFLEGS